MLIAPATIPMIPSPSQLDQVSDAELASFADLIYRRTGIRVSPQKKTLLSNRLRRRLRQTGIGSFAAYFSHLKAAPANGEEWDAFLQEITTHETYLFRDELQWKWLADTFLPQHAAAAREGGTQRSLRIWSAACSTGDEAATAACCVAACVPNLSQWSVRIIGTDIGIGAVQQAKAAVFGERAMRLVPNEYRARFFLKAKDANIWQAKPVLTEMCDFRRHNLMQPMREKAFDLIFLKNVLIYFDAASKQTVLDHVVAALRPGGSLVVGAAEGVAELIRDCQRIQPWLYRKPKKNGNGDE